MGKAYTFEDFRAIIATLRSKNGCPWDREQTHESLKPCMIEEAAEVAASIRIYEQTGDDSNLCEELGDVLLQVFLHSQIASEENRFTVDDVINQIAEKMIRRHPHVFGDATADTSADVLMNWEEIKKKEKEQQSNPILRSELHNIPVELPALMRAQKVGKKIEKRADNASKIEDEIALAEKNIRQLSGHEMGEKEAEEAVGALFYHCANLARKLHVDAEQALMNTIDRKIAEQDEKNH